VRNRLLLALSAVGLLLGILGAWHFSVRPPPQPPAFNPAADPYAHGIYANGIIESAQASGENVNIYPEVSGPITQVLVAEGQAVRAGTPLLTIDPSVQQALAAQQKAQAEAAATLLEELRKQPRPETLEVARAQMESAAASLRQVRDTLDKQRASYAIDPRSVSKDVLDTAENAARVAAANLEVARRQYELTRAGAWVYDVRNQEKASLALQKQYEASYQLLAKYTVRAPVDGTVLALAAGVGSYVSPQGTYDSYTQGPTPVVVMSGTQNYLSVRVYVDEILVAHLPPRDKLVAQMQVRGTDAKFPLEFVRIQPYVTPKIELSNQRQERVDLRVLPVLFRFAKPAGVNLYPGQLVDVYIGSK
jgi:HlyD family secretion protein